MFCMFNLTGFIDLGVTERKSIENQEHKSDVEEKEYRKYLLLEGRQQKTKLSIKNRK